MAKPKPAPKPKPVAPIASLADLVRAHLRAHEAGRRAYKRADALLEQIAGQTQPNMPIHLSPERIAYLRDQFAGGKMVVFKPCGVRRYEIEVE